MTTIDVSAEPEGDVSASEGDPVAVVLDPVPCFRAGLARGLGTAGIHVDEPRDVSAWLVATERPVLLISVSTPADLKELAGRASVRDGLPIVGLVGKPTREAFAQLLAVGATAVVARSAPIELIVDITTAAVEGRTILPTEVARSLARTTLRRRPPERLSTDQVRWLRALASEATVAELAADVGYSTREMHRRLHDVYERMGVKNLRGALVQAARWGILGEEPTGAPSGSRLPSTAAG